MKALVLAGGSGTRLRPITYTGAKQLVPVANKPILYYVFDNIVKAGITEIGIIISPETGEEIKKSLQNANRWNVKMTFILQEKPLGIAHAVLTAQQYLGNDDFIMYLGDNLIGKEINSFVESFEEKKPAAEILLKEVKNPSAFGIAETNKFGRVIRLVEKPKDPKSNLALVGIYVFSSRIFDAIKKIKPSWRGELEITDAIQKLIDWDETVNSVIIDDWWLDTGKKDDLLNANRIVLDEWLKKNIQGTWDEKSNITGRVVIPKDCKIINSSIRGPVILGKGVHIENSFIGPYSSIGNHTHIISSSVEHVVLLENCLVSGISRLEDSVMGRNAIVRKVNDIRKTISLIVSDDSIIEF